MAPTTMKRWGATGPVSRVYMPSKASHNPRPKRHLQMKHGFSPLLPLTRGASMVTSFRQEPLETAFRMEPATGAQPLKWPSTFKHCPKDVPEIPPADTKMLPTYTASGRHGAWERGAMLRKLVDKHLAPGNAGALLVRGLPTRSAAEFAKLMAGCAGDTWIKRTIEPLHGPREVQHGMQLATKNPPDAMLMCHNETVYEGNPGDILVLACSEPAESGGENLLARNADYTPRVSSELQAFVKEHGGLRTVRRFYDATNPPVDLKFPPYTVSWQERCGFEATSRNRSAAEAAFHRMFGDGIDVTWEDDGTMVITNACRTYNADGNWCNAVHPSAEWGMTTAADGTLLPAELLEGLAEAEAGTYQAVRLEAGDVVFLDNMRVAHGRMPYRVGAKKRAMFTYMANRMQS